MTLSYMPCILDVLDLVPGLLGLWDLFALLDKAKGRQPSLLPAILVAGSHL